MQHLLAVMTTAVLALFGSSWSSPNKDTLTSFGEAKHLWRSNILLGKAFEIGNQAQPGEDLTTDQARVKLKRLYLISS